MTRRRDYLMTLHFLNGTQNRIICRQTDSRNIFYPPASAATVPRSMPCILGGCKHAVAALVYSPPRPPPPATNPFRLMTNRNQTSPAPHPQNQPRLRFCTRATAAAAAAIAASQSPSSMLSALFVFEVFSAYPPGKEAVQLIILAASRFS